LYVDATTTDNDDGSKTTTFTIEASIVFEDDSLSKEEREDYVVRIMNSLPEGYNGNTRRGSPSFPDATKMQPNAVCSWDFTPKMQPIQIRARTIKNP
jgi:hypothetical protein